MKICVLMSTYNGEKFLAEQIDSILNQDIGKDAELELLVRDDGSADGTIAILESYQSRGALQWYTGSNLKTAKSFWNLLQRAGEADYYAFSDQDDVWFPGKLRRAVEILAKNTVQNVPFLYCGCYIETDSALNPLKSKGKKDKKPHIFADYTHALIYSVGIGCTFVFNDIARQRLLHYDTDKFFIDMHDRLAHKIILINGKMVIDNCPLMYYRQHGSNVIGAPASGIKSLRMRARSFLSGKSDGVRSHSAKDLLNVFGDQMDKDVYEITDIVANYKKTLNLRIRFLLDKRFRTKTINDIFLFMQILCGKI